MSTTVHTDKLHFRQIAGGESDWLYNLRKNSWNAFNDSPMPDRVRNLWRYTDPGNFMTDIDDSLLNAPPSFNEKISEQSRILKPEFSAYGYNRADFSTFALIDPELADNGVIFKELSSALRDHEDLAAGYLGQLVGPDAGKFESLNTALWNTGLFLFIPDNTIIDRPIRLQRHPAGLTTFHRLLIITGKNSTATIIDDYSGECRKEKGLVNSAVEIFVGDSSSVSYAGIQRHVESCRSYITQRSKIERNGRMVSIYAGLGGEISKANVGAVLNGAGADSRMYGVVFAGDNQHFDYHTLHHHQAGDTYSNIDFKVVLRDKATSAYTGLIKIDEDARNSQAYQVNRNLLLNKGARAESIPELEILCDEVQCTHGATMGPVDPEMIFYLTSRGITRDEAVRTIVSGFVEPTVSKLPEELRTILNDHIQNKLEG